MNLCFLIYNYFPYGGQQRDFLRLVNACIDRGHKVKVFTLRWQGDVPEGLDVTLVPIKSSSRLKLYRRFSEWVHSMLANQEEDEKFDAVIGFNKMPSLDVYFAADSCFIEKADTQRGAYYKYTPRYKHFLTYEQAVFGDNCSTQVFVLSPLQRDAYLKYYPQCDDRLHLLPAGMTEDRKVEKRDLAVRESMRAEFGVSDNEILILQVGSGFRIKGVDRALKAIASLPDEWRGRVNYILVGQGKPNRFLRLAKKLGLENQVSVLPGRDDIPRFFAGADLLLHPAYQESAGYVLLEAAIAGLPVLTTASCGYAFHIEQANVGEVCAEPFQQQELNKRLLSMLRDLPTASWSENGIAYGADPDLYRMSDHAAELIERLARTGLI